MPELENEVHRLKPREDQLLLQLKENEKTTSNLRLQLRNAEAALRPCTESLESARKRIMLLQVHMHFDVSQAPPMWALAGDHHVSHR